MICEYPSRTHGILCSNRHTGITKVLLSLVIVAATRGGDKIAAEASVQEEDSAAAGITVAGIGAATGKSKDTTSARATFRMD